jgi:8-oxo-dGTP pyrophosphatase MutT (NUDIX family)
LIVPQAGGIAYRREGDDIAILLVRAKRDPTVWILPKGHIEPGESPADTALRETEEEAGVTGELIGPVGAPLVFDNGRELVSVQYFLIRATAESGGAEGRVKQWFRPSEVMAAVIFEETRQLLREAIASIPR